MTRGRFTRPLTLDVRSTNQMKLLSSIAVCGLLLGCTDKHSLVTLDQQTISEIAVAAIAKERPYISPADLPLLRINYVYINRRNYPVKETTWDNPNFTDGVTATMLVKPTATVIRGLSGDGKEFSAYWHQEAVVDIRSNTAVRVQFLIQGREGGSQYPSYSRVLEGNELWGIVEVAFRYLFTNNASAAQQQSPAFFISLLRRDPPDTIVRRFADVGKPVLPDSAFKEGAGIKFFVNSITFLNKDTVSVQAGYYEGNLSASGDTLILNRENGKWIVVSSKQDWIS